MMLDSKWSWALGGADGLLTLLSLLAMLYFAFVTWRVRPGRWSKIFLVGALVTAALSGLAVLVVAAADAFGYSAGSENMWFAVALGKTVVLLSKALALLFAGVAFLAVVHQAPLTGRPAAAKR